MKDIPAPGFISTGRMDLFPLAINDRYHEFTKTVKKKATELKLKSQLERRLVGLWTALPLLPEDLIEKGLIYIVVEAAKPWYNGANVEEFLEYMKDWYEKDEFRQMVVYGRRHRANNTPESWNKTLNRITNDSNFLFEREDGESPPKRRRQSLIENDIFILKSQLQLVNAEISVGHFLEKLR